MEMKERSLTGSLDCDETEYSSPPPVPWIGLVLSVPGRGLWTPLTYVGFGTVPSPLTFRATTLGTVTGLTSHARPILVNRDPGWMTTTSDPRLP